MDDPELLALVCKEEAKARKRLEDALKRVQSDSENMSGADWVREMERQTADLQKHYDSVRTLRMELERDRKMLQRGTKRGIVMAIGFVFFYLSLQSLIGVWQSRKSTDTDYWVATVFFLIRAVVMFGYSWSLRKIPGLGKEDDDDLGSFE
jgi:hypothetical protein